MNKSILIIVCVAIFCPSVWGQDNSWSLQKCIHEGMKNAIEIKMQQLSVKKSQKEHNSIANQVLPVISFTGTQSYNFGSTIDPATNGRVSSNIQNDNFFLNAQMNLIDFKAFANAQRTRINIEKTKAELAVIENEYQLQLLESYFQALFTQELLKIQKEQFQNSRFNLNRVLKEVEIGSKPKSDLYDMQLSFAQEEIKILETEQLSVLQKKQLFQLMNVENKGVAEVVLEYAIEPFESKESAAISNPKVRFAELNHLGNQKETLWERANNLPSLTTFYGFSTFYYKPLNQSATVVDNFNTQISDNKNHQLGIQLNLPIFNGFRNNKRIAAAKLETEKSKFGIEQEKLKVKNQLDIESQNKANYVQLSSKLKEMKTYAEASFRTSQAKFSSGSIDAVVFSSVKNQLLSTEYDLLKNTLQQQYITLKISLIQGNTL
ncbi:TolC family protein [Flavobacterium sp. 25HG05S-40]|uniref:TolC family protein n=1 Tax=Flavobacterium sp. 25HG05S-40 TaxID=3458682 RepID=UPI004044C0F5